MARGIFGGLFTSSRVEGRTDELLMPNGHSVGGIHLGKVLKVDKDPKKRGRCKVYVPGVYPPLEGDTNTTIDALPWAERCFVTAGKQHGAMSVPYVDIGDLVWVGFKAMNTYYPIILGCAYGYAKDENQQRKTDLHREFQGFDGPPTQDESQGTDEYKNAKKDQDSFTDSCGTLHTQPADPYQTKYPNARGYIDPFGRRFIFDDTEGEERTLILLPHVKEEGNEDKINFIELDKDGNLTIRINSDTRTYLYTKGDVEQHIGKNYYLNVDQDMCVRVKGNRTTHVEGNSDETIDGNRTDHVKGNATETIDLDSVVTICQNSSVHVKGNAGTIVDGGATYTMGSGSSIHVTAGGFGVTVAGGDYNTTVTGGDLVTTTSGVIRDN